MLNRQLVEVNELMNNPTFQNISDPLVEFSPKLRKALEQLEKTRQYACCEVILKDSTVPYGVNILHKGEVTISMDFGAKGKKAHKLSQLDRFWV